LKHEHCGGDFNANEDYNLAKAKYINSPPLSEPEGVTQRELHHIHSNHHSLHNRNVKHDAHEEANQVQLSQYVFSPRRILNLLGQKHDQYVAEVSLRRRHEYCDLQVASVVDVLRRLVP